MFQNFALAALGMFVFTRQTVPFQSLDRTSTWRHPTNAIMREITGGRFSIKALELMADSGGAFPLIDGATFEIIGFFVIENIQETRTEFFGDGAPRAIDFTMNLKRTDDPMLIAIADSLMSNL